MLSPFTKRLRKVYNRATNSIAFAPALISLFLGSLSLFLLYQPNNFADSFLEDKLRIFSNLDAQAAQNLLSAITAGSISIAVFSFSMVMLVMSQASTIYTPKILDGLTRDKRPQRILGTYIGTVLFCLPQLLALNETKKIPLAALLIAIILMMLNMFIFIAFIDYVTRSVKPAVICRRIYLKVSRGKYRDTEEREGWQARFETGTGYDLPDVLAAQNTGYLQSIDTGKLMNLCEEHQLDVKVMQREGQFVLKGSPLLRISRLPEDDDGLEELKQQLYSAFFYSDIEDVENNAYYAYRQLTDIAVKAMSPGINDIGTARLAIDFLLDLISDFAAHRVPEFLENKEKKCSISFHSLRLHDLFELCLDEIRIHSTTDKHIMLSLMRGCVLMLQKLPDNERLKTEVREFSSRLMKNLHSPEGLEFSEYIEEIYERDLKQYLD